MRTRSRTMVGREAELQHLSEVFEAVRRGTALGAIVTGEAGIGKTRLLDEFVGSLPDEVVLARGQCWDTGVPGSPFVAVRGLLRDLAAHVGVETLLAAGGASGHRLATVVPELHRDPADRSSGPVDRDLLHDLVGQVLSNLAARAPVVAVVEDLHWADAASLDLLRAVVNTVRAPGLMLLASSRTEHPAVSTVLGDLLVDLERHRGVSLITVERLSPSLVSDLARQIAGKDLAADALGTLVDRSEGVPFFVEELLGLPSLDGALPGTARGLLLARYLRLDESTQELVRVLAAGGTRVEHSVVTQVLGPDPAGSDSALRQAVSAQVVSVDGTAYTFRHALLREAVYDEMLPGERLRVHAGYARALAAAPGGDSRLAEIAHHWWSAQDHPRALEATVRAAERARAAGAYATAGTLGERALDLWSLVPDAARVAGCQRLDLLLRTVDDYVEVDHPRALTLVDAALAECPEEDHRHRAALLHLAWVFRSDNGLPGAREAIEQAVALLPDDDHGRREDVTWLQVTCGWGMELMHSDVRRAQDVLQDVVAVGRALLARGDPGADTGQVRHELARSLTNLGTCRSMLGDLDGAFAAFDEALEWGGNEPLARLRDATWRTILLSELGRFQEALDVAGAGAALARDLGLSGWLDELSLESVEAHLGLGNLTAAETLLDQLDPLNMAPYERAYATARRVELLLWRDEAEAAASLYRGARDLLDHVRGGDVDDDLELSRVAGHLALALGDLEAAWDVVSRFRSVPRFRHGPVYGLLALGATVLRRWRQRGTDPPGAQGSDVETWLRTSLAAVPDWDVAEHWQPLVSAELSGADGRGTDPAAWCDAVAASESGRLGAHVHAYALVELGRVLLGAGDRPAAAQALERAERFCREKGFVRQLRLAAALSTDAGLAPARRRSTRHSPDLTGREKQVLALVAQGLTNRQIGERLFISDKTASVHVSAILRRLGVSSRTEAALQAGQLGLGPGEPRATS